MMLTTADRISARPRIELVVVLLRAGHAGDERRRAATRTPAAPPATEQALAADARLTSSPSLSGHPWRHAR